MVILASLILILIFFPPIKPMFGIIELEYLVLSKYLFLLKRNHCPSVTDQKNILDG